MWGTRLEMRVLLPFITKPPRTNFGNGTALVPMDQIGWRMISELMEYTSTKDQHYTNSPKDRNQDAWRALEPVDYIIDDTLCNSN